MKALVKTLIGDVANLSVVAVILFAAAALTWIGESAIAVYAIPLMTLAGVAWLARR